MMIGFVQAYDTCILQKATYHVITSDASLFMCEIRVPVYPWHVLQYPHRIRASRIQDGPVHWTPLPSMEGAPNVTPRP